MTHRAPDFTTPITPAEGRVLIAAMESLTAEHAGRAPQAMAEPRRDVDTTGDTE